MLRRLRGTSLQSFQYRVQLAAIEIMPSDNYSFDLLRVSDTLDRIRIQQNQIGFLTSTD
jgi:hypothetical protein